MNLRFEPITLDCDDDSMAWLIFRDARLTAIVSRLGKLHEELEGRFYVEAVFDGMLRGKTESFRALADVEAWIARASRISSPG